MQRIGQGNHTKDSEAAITIFLSQSGDPLKFTGRNFMFVPTPSIPPGAFQGLIILSGVAIIDFAGNSPGDWRRDESSST